MKRLVKLLVLLAVVLVIGVIVAAVGAVFYIDSLAKRGVEFAGTRALGVETTLDAMSVGIMQGQVTLDNLQVANPSDINYSSPRFMQLGHGAVAVSLGSLMKDQVIVPELTLKGLDLHLEKKEGKSNYQVILDNLSRGEQAPPTQEDQEGKKFIIRELTLQDITVHVDLLPVGGSLARTKLTFPQIKLNDVGSESEGGVVLSELAGVVIKALLQAVVEKSGELPGAIGSELTAGLGKLEDIQAKGLEVLEGATTQLTEGLDKATQTLDQATQGIDQAAKDLGKATDSLDKAAKGLGNLLGGKKKDDEKKD